MLIRSGSLDVVVIDSVAALVPRAEIEGEMGDTHVGLQARLMSQALRKLAGTISRSNTTVIFINQMREKIGVMFGNPETTPGGRALKFYASGAPRHPAHRVHQGRATRSSATGCGSRWSRTRWPRRSARPSSTSCSATGISREGSLLDVAVDYDVVRKSGAWYTYDGDQLGQGRENAKRFLRENPEVAVQLAGPGAGGGGPRRPPKALRSDEPSPGRRRGGRTDHEGGTRRGRGLTSEAPGAALGGRSQGFRPPQRGGEVPATCTRLGTMRPARALTTWNQVPDAKTLMES